MGSFTDPDLQDSATLRVVIAGGGVGAVETLLALDDLAGPRVQVTLVAPHEHFEVRALRTIASFTRHPAPTASIRTLVRRTGAKLRLTTLRRVVAGEAAVLLGDGGRLAYDELVVAVGAHARPAYQHGVVTYGAEALGDDLGAILADVREGRDQSVAFVVPPGVTWALPLYELALMTSERLAGRAAGAPELHLVTPEPAPLAIFGPQAAQAVGALLDRRGITLHTQAYASVDAAGVIRMAPGGEALVVDRIVALPVLDGPAVRGLPADPQGFLPIDSRGRARGVDHVSAVGDATTFPIKQGGIACQLADTVAHDIANRAGAPVEPLPFRPVLHGQVVTDTVTARVDAAVHGGDGEATVELSLLWRPSQKVNGRYLSAALAKEAGVAESAEGISVRVALDDAVAMSRGPMDLDPYSPTVTSTRRPAD